MYKQIVVITFLLFTSSYLFAEDNKILSIEIEGNQRIDKETIISYSKTEVGQTYSESLGNNILNLPNS